MKLRRTNNMAKNKPLNVSGYMQGVKDNQPTEKKNIQLAQGESGEGDAALQDNFNEIKPEINSERTLDELKNKTAEADASDNDNGNQKPAPGNVPIMQNNEEVQFQNPSPVQQKRGVGRPQKSTKRDQKQVFKLDPETATNLMLIKAFNKIDLQDVIFTSLVSFLEKHFDRERGLDVDAIELINSTIDKYNTRS
jgi:hypothetical protein